MAVISGGASGLCEDSVRHLVANGAKAAIFDLDEKRGNSLVEEPGNATRFFKTDVTDGQSVQNAVDGTIEAFGPIHVAISCAGVVAPMKVIGPGEYAMLVEQIPTSVHPEMANLPDIFVALKILSSEYQAYASGKILCTPRSRPNFPISGCTLTNPMLNGETIRLNAALRMSA